MALYSPGRRRAIILTVLTSALLLTIDLRGNALLDGGRSLWSGALRPLESAAEVVTRPIENAWHGVTEYGDLERRYDELEAENAAIKAENFVARYHISQNRELRTELALTSPGDYKLVAGLVIGPGPTNVDQMFQIDKGTRDNLCVGMPVLSSNWLIGRITHVDEDRAWVLLVTDSRYTIAAKVVRPESIDPEQLPEGVTPVTTTTTPPTTVPALALDPLPGDSLPADASAPPADPGADVVETTTTTTTTLPPPEPIRSTGAFSGRGPDRLPIVAFQGNLTPENRPQVGDIVLTTGGELSLAPPDLVVGVVSATMQGGTDVGLLTEVQTSVDFDNLEFVSVMQYVSEQESSACDAVATD